ncbi:ferredoxin [Cryobacterium sp. SO2]|uniref:ferredoxin n=1 Tax=Cryobacterium sp. SO2 TaxID=1897060 RepID=UPI00223C93F6|nr:ferredoxin [Cryobacterium sp. SO2]WEO78603.1 ferredoxin [Cryobacterium sp. SO2]
MSARMLDSTGRLAQATERSALAVLHIDWTACDGRGLCTELLPDLLHRDDWGYPLALGYGSDVPVPGALGAAATDAVSLCPRLALTLRDPVRNLSRDPAREP